jgi:hypothetical protein
MRVLAASSGSSSSSIAVVVASTALPRSAHTTTPAPRSARRIALAMAIASVPISPAMPPAGTSRGPSGSR